MRKGLPTLALLAALLGLATNPLAAQEGGLVELAPPRALRAGESLELQVATAPLPSGARLVVKTAQGEVLGAITPRDKADTGTTATVPVPRAALTDGRLRLRLEVIQQGAAPRAPLAQEVQLHLLISP